MVKWTGHAKANLRHIHDFIAEDSRHYAKKVVRDIVDKTIVLNELPRLGRSVPDIGDEQVREISMYSYRIIYEIEGNNISVLAVVHMRRDLKAEDIGK